MRHFLVFFMRNVERYFDNDAQIMMMEYGKRGDGITDIYWFGMFQLQKKCIYSILE